jgi:hypothetical protein
LFLGKSCFGAYIFSHYLLFFEFWKIIWCNFFMSKDQNEERVSFRTLRVFFHLNYFF